MTKRINRKSDVHYRARSTAILRSRERKQRAKWWLVTGAATATLGGFIAPTAAPIVEPQEPLVAANAEPPNEHPDRPQFSAASAMLVESPSIAPRVTGPDLPRIELPDYQISKDTAVKQAAIYEGISFVTGLVPLPGHHIGEAANATTQILANLAGQLRDVAADPDAIAVGVHPALNLSDVIIYPILPLEGGPRKPDPTV